MSRPAWATVHNAAPLEPSQPWASRVPYVPQTTYRWGRGTGAWRSGQRLLVGVFTASCCYHRSSCYCQSLATGGDGVLWVTTQYNCSSLGLSGWQLRDVSLSHLPRGVAGSAGCCHFHFTTRNLSTERLSNFLRSLSS